MVVIINHQTKAYSRPREYAKPGQEWLETIYTASRVRMLLHVPYIGLIYRVKFFSMVKLQLWEGKIIYMLLFPETGSA